MKDLETLSLEISTIIDDHISSGRNLTRVVADLEWMQKTVNKHLEMVLREHLERARRRHAILAAAPTGGIPRHAVGV